MNPREQRTMATRPDVTRGRLMPATEDLSALTASGEDPTVLAFALGSRPGRVVYEVLNRPEPLTLVYRVDGPDGPDGPGGLAAVNRALDDAGFQLASVRAESPPGQVPHDAHWPARIAELLAG